jgi:tetratricopeptide (TPR) repeat protein
MPAAGSLLARTAVLLADDDADRPSVMIEAAECLAEAGELHRATELAERAASVAADRGDATVLATARIVRDRVRLAVEGEAETDPLAMLTDLLPALEAADAHASLARAWRLATEIHMQAERWGEAEAAARKMIEHADLAGDRALRDRMTASIAICLLYGPTPADEAIARCEELLAAAEGDRKVEGLVMIALAHLVAMRGDFEHARELARSSRARLEEFGWRFLAALTSIDSGPIELLAGDAVAAERELRRDYETLEAMGERNYIATVAALLAEALFRQGRLEEADAFSKESEATAAEDDVASQVLWRIARAKIVARGGDADGAVSLARSAVDLHRGSDEPDLLGTALLDLAEVSEAAGATEDARAALAEAIALFEAKGNVVSAAVARERVEALG